MILNRKELEQNYRTDGVANLVIEMFRQEGDTFFDCFRGAFSGALYECDRDRWLVWTSHFGDNIVFWYESHGCFAIGNQANYVLEAIKLGGGSLTSSSLAVASMLTYAFMIDESTYVNEVRRLLPGHYLVIENGHLVVHEYFSPKSDLFDLSYCSEIELINEIDRRFAVAVDREFAKDKEQGFSRHLADLSGGLDSRMVNWVAHELGYKNVLNLTWSAEGSADAVIAEEIARDLGNEWKFDALNDMSFLRDLERLVRMNDGLSLYSGISGGERILRGLNDASFGLTHSGQLGDVIIGSYVHSWDKASNSIRHGGYYSGRFIDALPTPDASNFRDYEEYLMKVRGLLGMLSTHPIKRNYYEVASPFLDVDLFKYCMSIPIKLKTEHKLYRKWILTKHPQAGQYVWEAAGCSLAVSELVLFAMRGKRAVSHFFHSAMGPSKQGMVPLDYWIQGRSDITQWLDATFARLREGSAIDGALLPLVDCQFKKGTVTEKSQALTALAASEYWMNYGHFYA